MRNNYLINTPSEQSKNLQCMVFAFFGYLMLAIGGLGLGQEIDFIRIAVAPIWVIAFLIMIIPIHSMHLRMPISIICFYILVSFYLLFQLMRSEEINLALVKIDGFLLSGLSIFIIWRYGISKYADHFIDSIIRVSAFILILTILYKLNFGFWDRGTRFFLNGPNVYGWMMALAGVLSFYRYFQTNYIYYIYYFIIFLLAILWTSSKRPFIALIGGIFLFLMLERKVGKLLFGIIIFSGVITFLFINDFVPDRYQAIYRLMIGTTVQADFGSIGIRQLTYNDGLKIFSEHLLFGIGIGNWDIYSSTSAQYGSLTYPHNIIIEILAEHGLVGMLLFGGTFVITFWHTSRLGRTIMIMFFMCLIFSGDMEYWRFIVALPLAFITVRHSNELILK